MQLTLCNAMSDLPGSCRAHCPLGWGAGWQTDRCRSLQPLCRRGWPCLVGYSFHCTGYTVHYSVNYILQCTVYATVYSRAIKFATKHNEVISTMCQGVRLALLIQKNFFFLLFFWTLQNYACKFWPPKNHMGPPLWWKFWKIVWMLILISQKKRPVALNTMQKTPALCNVPFPNKSRKTLKKYFFEKMGIFGIFPWFFLERYIVESWSIVHCIQCIMSLLLSYQKLTFRQFYKIFMSKKKNVLESEWQASHQDTRQRSPHCVW